MKDSHLHLACKGVASLTDTRNRLRRYLFWKVRKVGTFTELPLYLENIELFIGHGGCSKKRTKGDS